ncbi:MAG: hypothetical protein ACM32E_14605 [Gemmatimonadota bacterium]
MSEHQPGWPGHSGRDAVSAAIARARGRSRLRVATLVAGGASLVAAGAVALNLPAPTHTKITSVTTPAAPSSSPTVVYTGDDGGGDDGSRAATAAQGTAKTGKSTVHTTSGGS